MSSTMNDTIKKIATLFIGTLLLLLCWAKPFEARFDIQQHVLPSDLAKPWSHEIWYFI